MDFENILILSAAATTLAAAVASSDNRKRKWGIHPDNRRRGVDGEYSSFHKKEAACR